MHFLALFHTARTLSGSLRSPPSPRGEGFVRRYSFSTHACIRSDNARKAVSSFRCLPHWGRGTASAVDRVFSLMAHLRRSPSLSFIPLVPYPARSARHLPHAGKALSVVILFLRICVYSLWRCEKSGILVSQPSPLGKGDRAAVDRVLSQAAHLRRSFPLVFHAARTLSGSLRSPPSPRGEGFVRRYSFSPRILYSL